MGNTCSGTTEEQQEIKVFSLPRLIPPPLAQQQEARPNAGVRPQ